MWYLTNNLSFIVTQKLLNRSIACAPASDFSLHFVQYLSYRNLLHLCFILFRCSSHLQKIVPVISVYRLPRSTGAIFCMVNARCSVITSDFYFPSLARKPNENNEIFPQEKAVRAAGSSTVLPYNYNCS